MRVEIDCLSLSISFERLEWEQLVWESFELMPINELEEELRLFKGETS